MKYVGENIREVRKAKGLTLEVLSGLTGISESFLGMVERGASSISLETLVALCDALGITPNDLLLKGREVKHRPTDKCDLLLALMEMPRALILFMLFVSI
jgi:transcriptional regulator with XRE-family HTH domain